MNHFYTAFHTDVGKKKKTNQDSLLLQGITDGSSETLLAVLCDGMGGISKGELASATVVRYFAEWFQLKYTERGSGWKDEEIEEQWKQLLNDANQKLLQYGAKEQMDLGTTATAVMITSEGRYLICHVGDTRVYRMGQGMEQLTEDHTYIAREIKRGNMTPKQALTDTRRNVLLQCIGIDEYLEPQILFGEFNRNEELLICSDGFRHCVTEREIKKCLQSGISLSEETIKKKLKELVDLNMDRGEADNISAICIKLK